MSEPTWGDTTLHLEGVGYHFRCTFDADDGSRVLEGTSYCDITLELYRGRWCVAGILDYAPEDASLDDGRVSWGLLRALYSPDISPAAAEDR